MLGLALPMAASEQLTATPVQFGVEPFFFDVHLAIFLGFLTLALKSWKPFLTR